MKNINLKIKLFGFLQNCSDEEIISLNMIKGVTVLEVKKELLKRFSDPSNDQRLQDLPNNCVLANDEEILFDDFELQEDANLVILPPVCGG